METKISPLSFCLPLSVSEYRRLDRFLLGHCSFVASLSFFFSPPTQGTRYTALSLLTKTALPSWHHLMHFTLAFNELHAEAAKLLAGALHDAPHLVKVCLKCHRVYFFCLLYNRILVNKPESLIPSALRFLDFLPFPLRIPSSSSSSSFLLSSRDRSRWIWVAIA